MKISNAFLAVALLTQMFVRAGAAEVTRAQFSKAQLDWLGYPTNAAQAADLGRSDARRDLSNGVVRVPMFGLPMPWSGEYDRILEQKYKVGSYGLGGCVVSAGLVAYADGYSEVSRAYIEQKHGTNIWQQARAQAEEAWKKKLSPELEKEARQNVYRVRAGDYLGRIAREHGVTVKALQEANPGVNPTRLKVGQEIRIPADAKP